MAFLLKEDKVWAAAGHEVAFGQYVYSVQTEKKKSAKKIEVIRSTHNIGVKGEDF